MKMEIIKSMHYGRAEAQRLQKYNTELTALVAFYKAEAFSLLINRMGFLSKPLPPFC